MKTFTAIVSVLMLLFSSGNFKIAAQNFRNPDLDPQTRALALLEELTLEEKISLLGYDSPAIERLQVPAYNWWNEALHGVARAGEATVFPQAIALAATFDTALVHQVADAISTEARSKYNLNRAKGFHNQYMGISFWTPNINIFRDPRWGRGQETYGEDPFLTAVTGKAFVQGLQGNDPHHLKTAAGAKHFAVHSGPEADRHHFNAIVDEKDLRETYLPAFKTLVDNGVETIMCAYNRVNGEPCCTGKTLLQNILRDEWGFNGQVVTDCWALDDIWRRHKTIPTRVEVAAAAVKTGVNLDCSNILQDDVKKAIDQNLLTREQLDSALLPTLRTQIKLGFYDNPDESPYSTYGADSVNNAYHVELSRTAAEKSMVLLKNNGILPLSQEKTSSVMVVGENAASISVLTGNYHGMSGKMVTFAEGLVEAGGPGTSVQYDMGCSYADTTSFGGIWAAGFTDVTVAVLGLNPLLEGEQGDAFLSKHGGDKKDLSMPRSHEIYMQKLRESHDHPIIAVVTGGSAIDVSAIEPFADAIIFGWYPGQQGGTALANLIFGNTSPSGRLPLTFYKSVDDLPPYDDYSMQNRTYRYFDGDVLYPFGYGLSYSTFEYNWSSKPASQVSKEDLLSIDLEIENTGDFDAEEVVQVYITYPKEERMPLKELKGFSRVTINAGETEKTTIQIPVSELKKWDTDKNDWKLFKGNYSILVSQNAETPILKHSFTIK
ncbi:glycoside hydrolase family 3 N-terminal domain-containing protein [Marinilabilia rubra]|uniref:Glycosyl hydrolase n=1 Tax=Marinilabilia rubra TaxID=2162893 RepID=A0A2U2B4B2_9BACT|nr:glycoside hydrolase family 3 N-terminal domain-containing protein [Marinilabilia rubra]PWD97877.1 glycosyl hydrolase [Marinilabilia rubra]